MTIAKLLTVSLTTAALCGMTGFGADRHGVKKRLTEPSRNPVLWEQPVDIASRNLFYGPGGQRDQPPQGRFVFVEEDFNGTNPKFVVRDENGVKWTVKLGAEAKPETAASRLTWGAGYFSNEDYFLPQLKVDGLQPEHMRRGRRMIARDGTVHNVRLKRHLEDEKKIANWAWSENVFSGSRELNGLRVLMSLLNNWDLTDENNEILSKTNSKSGVVEQVYMVSDEGSTLGGGRLSWPLRIGRGDLHAYAHSKFITRLTPDSVDVFEPSRPEWFFFFDPPEYRGKTHLRWIGQGIPRADAKWLGEQMGRLSPQQIRDAFRAAGYAPEQIERFADTVEYRIHLLQDL